jgi:diguanylate cyclase (GGDEF)-like protein/PAS domain S-box-containing protein
MDLGSGAPRRFWHDSRELTHEYVGPTAPHTSTETTAARAALRESEAINRSIVEASSDCVMLLDLEGILTFLNGPGACALEIDDPTIYLGRPWASLWPSAARPLVQTAITAARDGGVGRFSGACPTARGNPRWWDVVVSPVFGDAGNTIKLVAMARDITEQREAEERLFRAATRDALTGLPNRSHFQQVLSEAVTRARSECSKLGLLLLDLDGFKEVNDTLGHDAGDALLQTFAKRLVGCSRHSKTVARLGGDEFAVLFEEVTDTEELRDRANEIVECLGEPFIHAGQILECHATIGAALFPYHGSSPDELLKNADIALYVAKASDRGGVATFTGSHRAAMQQNLSMVSLARAAVREDRIVPFYQPKIAVDEGSIHGFEALLRWRHPRSGIQLPAAISSAFDDFELAREISDKMIGQAVNDMREWLDRGISFGHVAVNAGAAEFRRNNFAETILERLEKAGIPPNCFQLEVTETVFLGRGSEYVDRALKLLDAAGVTIALDDFGTGFASLRHLKQFPVHVIKIDQSFVRDLDVDPDDAAIIAAVINLGQSLKIDVVAEGVETMQQEAKLQDLGCRFMQGFLYSEAIPASDVPALLRSWNNTPATFRTTA